MNVPENLRYTESHEWVKIDGDTATVGITDHAQEELTDIVYVELPENGRAVASGEACAVVESVKAASDIYAPLAGEVIETNGELDNEPVLVNTSPYEGGWLFKIKLSDAADAESLLDAAAYSKQIS